MMFWKSSVIHTSTYLCSRRLGTIQILYPSAVFAAVVSTLSSRLDRGLVLKHLAQITVESPLCLHPMCISPAWISTSPFVPSRPFVREFHSVLTRHSFSSCIALVRSLPLFSPRLQQSSIVSPLFHVPCSWWATSTFTSSDPTTLTRLL